MITSSFGFSARKTSRALSRGCRSRLVAPFTALLGGAALAGGIVLRRRR